MQRRLHLALVDPEADLAVPHVLGLAHAEESPRLERRGHGAHLREVEAAQRPLLADPAVRLVQFAQWLLKFRELFGEELV